MFTRRRRGQVDFPAHPHPEATPLSAELKDDLEEAWDGDDHEFEQGYGLDFEREFRLRNLRRKALRAGRLAIVPTVAFAAVFTAVPQARALAVGAVGYFIEGQTPPIENQFCYAGPGFVAQLEILGGDGPSWQQQLRQYDCAPPIDGAGASPSGGNPYGIEQYGLLANDLP